jgi:glycosyltransferase involved in cell wall biosynthesis
MTMTNGVKERTRFGSRDDRAQFVGANWSVIAATSREDAERYSEERGLERPLIRSKAEVLADPLAFWRELRSRRIDVLAVHSRAWRRQRSSEFFECVLAFSPVRRRLIVDGESGSEYELDRADLAVRLVRAPADAIQGLGMASREIAAFKAIRRKPPLRRRPGGRPDPGAVIAIWHGLQTSDVGGAATHITGILGGFRALGLRIGLVTTEPPPAQLTPVLDDVEVVSPLPPGARLTTDIEEVTLNRPIRDAATSLGRRLGPSIVYQRHRQFLWAGAHVSRATCAPLILEWNNSELWFRARYDTRRLGKLVTPVVEDIERYMLRAADLTAAVSSPAADMAIAAGADAERVAVIPNGVDIAEIDRQVHASGGGGARQPVIGWVGAFCQWHGTEVLVRALALLSSDARVLMIGDGERREACQTIARDLGVADRLELTGALPHSEAIRRLAQCDVLVSPHVEIPNQRFFGSPTKLFEYMAIGRPIVASRLEQLGDVLQDGSTARLVRPGDERELALTIDQVLGAPDRGRALGRAARQEAERHTWDRRARSIMDRLTVAPPAIAVGRGR